MSIMKRLQKYIKNKDGVKKKPTYKQRNIVITKGKRIPGTTTRSIEFVFKPDTVKKRKVKEATKPVKRKGQAKASLLRSRYNPSTDQWIKYTD